MNSAELENVKLILKNNAEEQYENNFQNYEEILSSSSEEAIDDKNKSNESPSIITIIFKMIFDFVVLALVLRGRQYYLLSLEGCSKSEHDCLFDIGYIIRDIDNCVTSTKYFFVVLFLIHMNFCSLYNILTLFFAFAEFIITDHGSTFLHHGILNLLGFFVILSVGEVVIIIFLIFYKLIRYKRFLSFFFLFAIFSTIVLIFIYKNKDNYYCKDWDKGLNNTYIDNDEYKYPCVMNIPKRKCLISIVGPFIDGSKIIGKDCKKRGEEEKTLLKNISPFKNKENVKRIGYPITIGDKPEISGRPTYYSDTLLAFVKKNLVDMDDPKQLKKLGAHKKPEVIVDFTEDPYGQMKININHKDKLAKERKLKERKDSKNILFIFMDNLSRNHFYRQYPKTTKFFEQFFSYEGYTPKNKKGTNEKYHGFQFFKYTKFNGATLANSMPMFDGVYHGWRNKMVSIVRDFKNNGYITANIQDVCHKELMSIGRQSNYVYVEFDHEYAAPSCDPTMYTYGYSFTSGENGIFRKCQYGKESFEHALEYTKKFWISYKDNKKFVRLVNTYAHEYSGEKSKYTDEPLRDFLLDLYENSLLKDTTLFFVGDHGFALMGVYKILESHDWQIERDLPIFLIIESDNPKLDYDKQYKEILNNQQTFVTAFDIFYTLRWILYDEEYKKKPLNGNRDDGECLFKYIDFKKRHCKKYKIISCQCSHP